jgi:hypothetical protein
MTAAKKFRTPGRGKRSCGLFFILSLLIPAAAFAQSDQMLIYPEKNQSQAQQDKDRYECHRWAVQQTGYDPSVSYPSNPNTLDPQPYQPSRPYVLKGAARGATLGVVGGAMTENAGKGAAAGAAMGEWRGLPAQG